MPRNVRRRRVLKGIGATGIAGVAGCIGEPGGGDGGDAPDLLTVIGYPESGVQLFKDYYGEHDADELPILVPDGLRDGELPSQVGHDMGNVTGTAPAAGGPNQEAFATMFEDVYGGSPGVFTAQTYDSVATLILANAAAGQNDGTSIRNQMRRIANPGGMAVGPGNFVDGVQAAAEGEDVDFKGASSSVNFNDAGDPASAAYDIWGYNADDEATTAEDTQAFEGDNPDGSGPSADSGSGGFGREIQVGILLPETGDLSPVGQPMIDAGRLPVQQVNDSDIDLTVNAQIEDTQTNSEPGTSAANALVNAGVPAVCGSASSGVNVPVSKEVFIPNEVVGCSPSSTALSVTNLEDDDYIFRTAPSDLLQGRVMAKVAAERLDAGTLTTLYVNNDYGQQLSERLTSLFEDTHDGTVQKQVAFNKAEDSYSDVISDAMSS
jgi:ABC-type branched-subunit amino acid transport system substrate-binding protein